MTEQSELEGIIQDILINGGISFKPNEKLVIEVIAREILKAGYRKLEPLDKVRVYKEILNSKLRYEAKHELSNDYTPRYSQQLAYAICSRFGVEKADYEWEGIYTEGGLNNTLYDKMKSVGFANKKVKVKIFIEGGNNEKE